MSHAEPDVSGTVLDAHASAIARTYAEALLGAAEKAGPVEPLLEELEELVRDVWTARPEFRLIMSSPSVSAPDKDRILTEVFQGRAQPTLVQFLRVLNRHGRLEILEAVARQARAAWDRRQNRRGVLVRSAVPLDEGQIEALRQQLATVMRMTPVIQTQVDPDLIGGLVVQVGDFVYDSSVKNRFLGQLRRRLIEDKIHEFRARRAEVASAAD
jgi:F-type H+-transporting ATPase subunit delta